MRKTPKSGIFSMGLLLCLSCTIYSPAFAADDGPDLNLNTLTGDWNGQRQTWLDQGVSLDFTHRSDIVRNQTGGMATGTRWLSYTDARARLDLNKLWGWEGWTAYTQYHSELGGKPNIQKIGSFIGVDNIEVKTNTAQFSELWLEKSMFDDRLAVLVGLYAIDSEFYVTDSSGVFLQPAMGMNISVGQTGKNGPPIYPMASFGTRLRYRSADKNTYAQLALLDGVPGDPANPRGSHIKFDKGDGVLLMAELGIFGDKPGGDEKALNKTAIGFWRYSASFDDLISRYANGRHVQRKNFGWYVLTERTLLPKAGHPGQGLQGFFRFGTAQKDINQSDWSVNLGLNYVGPFAGRSDDQLALGMTYARASEKYRLQNRSDNFESIVEATYKMQVRPWLSVQPVVQCVFNPNMDANLKKAWVVSLRTEVAF
ncbi:carbohydrate porin [Undibacterium sp. TS12]|uniref:carbohydrate porin n=1 Tax=Undibacterium sp. TS12 TaxID=2908202 RepID=UPI001F4C648A|nr:carbohydrate porin [Undibacterium sp. TS12]MCH8617846.1 carbohydrate porin [Undibacterium sp. TS12]